LIDAKEFGRRLYEFRRRNGRPFYPVTQQEIARIAGTSQTTVHRWENGQSVPDVLQWQRLLRHYGPKVTDQIFGENTEADASTHNAGNIRRRMKAQDRGEE
jgi:transcriptional regulator with XRE-family HTH domain